MRSALALLVASGALALGGCDQVIARHWGGHETVDLPACMKFEVADWKDADLWYVTRPMRPGEKPETHTYQASTVWGVLQGSITFVEHQCGSGEAVPQ